MKHLKGCGATEFYGWCTCSEIRAARIAKVNAAKDAQQIRVLMAGAIYAALGCTDVRNPRGWPEASKQIANVVLGELGRNKVILTLTSG